MDDRSTIFCVWSTEQTHFALAFSFSRWVLNTGLRLAQLCFNCLHTLRNLGRVKKQRTIFGQADQEVGGVRVWQNCIIALATHPHPVHIWIRLLISVVDKTSVRPLTADFLENNCEITVSGLQLPTIESRLLGTSCIHIHKI